jgi:hypothetical protein
VSGRVVDPYGTRPLSACELEEAAIATRMLDSKLDAIFANRKPRSDFAQRRRTKSEAPAYQTGLYAA